MRQDLQVKLVQSEQQLKQLKQSLVQSNGEFPDSGSISSEFSPSECCVEVMAGSQYNVTYFSLNIKCY